MSQLPIWTTGLHHDSSEAYVTNPQPQADETVTITLRVPPEAPVRRIYLVSMPDGEIHFQEMKASPQRRTAAAQYWEAPLQITMPRNSYRFKLMTPEGAYYYTAHGVSRANSPDSDNFVLLADYEAPAWVRETVFYQIFPERFYNGDPSNDVQPGQYERHGFQAIVHRWGDIPYPFEQAGSMDFYGGDLNGITQKLDYLTDLGVNGIYLCPIFRAESNHKYDILDFFEVDPHFGGNEALVELRQKTREQQIRLMLDVTPNHISFHHSWFTAVKADPQAPTAEYFARHPETDAWETWLGVPSLIKLNYGSQKLRDIMYRLPDSVLRRWLRPPYDIDGWRLDVANMTGNLRMNQLDHEVHREMRQSLKADKPDVYILGEHFHDGTPHTQGDELDAAMNYQGFNIPVRRWLGGEDLGIADGKAYGDPTLLPTDALAKQWQRFLAEVPYIIALQQFNQLGSHDTTRILYVTDGDKQLARLGAALLSCYPGVPCFYYGDEIGLTGGKDPDNRRTMPWDESEWDGELRAYHQQLIRIRRESPALAHGGFQLLYAAGDTVCFLREARQQRILFVGYRGPSPMPEIAIPARAGGLPDGTRLHDLLGGGQWTVADGVLALSGLAHGQALILEVDPESVT